MTDNEIIKALECCNIGCLKKEKNQIRFDTVKK